MLRSFVRRWLHSRDLGLVRRHEALLEHWRQELRVNETFLVAHRLLNRDRLTFLQIGAFDGEQNDQLHRFIKAGTLTGVLVEPQPAAFARLRQNYAGLSGVDFENAAVGSREGRQSMHRVRPEFASLCPRSEQMTSFSPAVLLKHYRPLTPNPEACIEQFEVPVVTFDTVLQKHRLQSLDLLKIDTEGYDYELLRLFDFARVRPAIVVFEQIHLSHADRGAAYELLFGHDYLLQEDGWDCLAYHRSCLEGVLAGG